MTTATKRNLCLALVIVGAICAASFGAGSAIYPWPTNWSLGGLASWTQPLIASGTALPNVASAATGDIFLVTDGAASATLYRLQGSAWATMTSSAGGAGTTDHAALSNLAFDDALHTGFDSAASATLDAASLSTHLADQTDPHGASTTFTVGVTVGSGTADTLVSRTGTGTVTIASYARIIPTTATPVAEIATGSLWYDSNTDQNKLKCWDGAAWNALW